MAEYIEREKALESVREKLLITDALPDGIPKDASTFTLASMQHSLESIPAADVRPVVLCRDCKHWDIDWVPNYAKENEHFCPVVTLTTRGDWFCADGEKREES